MLEETSSSSCVGTEVEVRGVNWVAGPVPLAAGPLKYESQVLEETSSSSCVGTEVEVRVVGSLAG